LPAQEQARLAQGGYLQAHRPRRRLHGVIGFLAGQDSQQAPHQALFGAGACRV
jgi:hypothetical protein